MKRIVGVLSIRESPLSQWIEHHPNQGVRSKAPSGAGGMHPKGRIILCNTEEYEMSGRCQPPAYRQPWQDGKYPPWILKVLNVIKAHKTYTAYKTYMA